MGALAIHTGATVYAADRIQWYLTYKNLANGAHNWKVQESRLWRFPPNGTLPTKMFRAPVEFNDVWQACPDRAPAVSSFRKVSCAPE